jgi:hypothetical protein
MLFLETSAFTGKNVDDAFLKVTEVILNQIKMGVVDINNEVNNIIDYYNCAI